MEFMRLSFVGGVAFVASVVVCSAGDAMFRGDVTHSGIYKSSSTPAIRTVKWRFKTASKVFSSPAVEGGTVYFGSSDHHIYAVNSADGTLRWKYRTKGGVNSSPAVANGLVYAASRDGNFYALDTADGKVKWQFKTGGERRFTAPGIHGAMPRTEMMPDPFDVFLSSPVISEGNIYFGSGDHHVYALDAKTGELKWKFSTGNVVHASPAIANGVLYIGSWDRNLYALEAATGREIWHFQTGDDKVIYNQIGIASSAAVADGTVYFGCRDGHFYAVDAKTGAMKWNHDNKMGWVIASPAVVNGLVLFPTSDGTRFKALDGVTGKIVFDIGNKAVSFSSPAIVGTTAYYGSSDGWLHAVDIKSGQMKAEFQTDGSKENASKYIDERGKFKGLYTDDTLEGMMIGLDRMFSLGSILSSPVVLDGVLYVGSTDGNLYALE
jgi:outer membrane protein assembly factor BamB